MARKTTPEMLRRTPREAVKAEDVAARAQKKFDKVLGRNGRLSDLARQ